MTKTTTCTECSRPVNSRNSAAAVLGAMGYHDVCHVCYDYWGWENAHSDERHGEDEDADTEGCWVCHPELREAAYPDAKKMSVPTGRANMSHAACKHAKTSTARAKCRKANNR